MKYIINEDQNKRLYRQSDEFKNAFLEVLKDSWAIQIKNGEDPHIDKLYYNMYGVEFNSIVSERLVFPEFRNFIGGDEIALEQVKRRGEKHTQPIQEMMLEHITLHSTLRWMIRIK